MKNPYGNNYLGEFIFNKDITLHNIFVFKNVN